MPMITTLDRISLLLIFYSLFQISSQKINKGEKELLLHFGFPDEIPIFEKGAGGGEGVVYSDLRQSFQNGHF